MGCSKNQKSSVLDYVLFVFLISCLKIPKSVAQSPQAQSEFQYQRLSPPLAIIIIVLIAALFFMAAFSIYIRHCGESSGMTGSVRQALSMRRRAAAGRGIDAAVLETFPTFTYAEVKDHHIGKGALECAVCLNEFEDDETLRLIPKCDHVFHPECIDAWLQSHDTCPVCRANLTPQPGEPPVQVPELSHDEVQDLEPVHQQNDEVSTRIVSEEEQRGQQVQPPQEQQEEGSVRLRPGAKRNLSFNVPNRVQKQGDDGSVKQIKRFMSFNLSIPSPRAIIKPMMFSKFRSHSTGHSLVLPGENLDRYTLRLPEGVRKEVINRALLNRTKSFANDTKGYRNGEGSSRGGRFNRRIDRYEPEGKSDQWVFTIAPPFFSRGLSMKSPRVGNETGEGSTSGSVKSAVKLPSFKCLEPKSDETHLMSANANANRPPV